MTRIVSKLPNWAKKPLRHLRNIAYSGQGRFCPVCGKSSRQFSKFGFIPRKDALCVHCGALERHRLLWLYMSKKTDFFDSTQKKMLHIAPEPCLEPRFKEHLGPDYLTADLFNPHAMVKMDITNIQYADESFNVIICSHVLEHVHDDKKAIKEFFRVLKNNGWAILLVPVTVKKTIEDSSIIEPVGRLEAFGQEDHVRRYGPDYVDRLREAGFKVEITRINDLVHDNEAVMMGLTPASGEIYYCTK